MHDPTHTHTHNALTKRLIRYLYNKTKNLRKQNNFKVILFSILVSFLGVALITYGATTIGSNINTGGTLTVSSNATLGDDSTDLIKSLGSFYASSTLQTTGATRFYSTLQADGLTTLGNSSTTQLSITGNLWINGFATTTSSGNIQGQGILTMLGTGTSTFSGGIQSTALNITSATASSTFANGIILSKGCFLMPDGTCAGGGGGTINSGTTGQFPYYAGSGTTLTATSSLFIHSNQNLGIGTTTPNWLLQAAGIRPFFTLSDTGAAANNKHWFLSSQGGNFYVGTSSDALNATSTYLTITNGGNVGVGTATIGGDTVGSKLQVEETGNDSNVVAIFKHGTGLNSGSYKDGLIVGQGGNFADDILSFWTDTTNGIGFIESVQINNSFNNGISLNPNGGKVGVGDPSPDAQFEISNKGESIDLLMISSNDDNDGNRLIVKNSGFVGIGTATPTTMFQVATSTTNATTTVEFGKANQNKGSCLKMYNSAGTLTYCQIDGTTLSCSATSCE